MGVHRIASVRFGRISLSVSVYYMATTWKWLSVSATNSAPTLSAPFRGMAVCLHVCRAMFNISVVRMLPSRP